MLVRDFSYELPAELIAQYPAAPGASRLLVADETGDRRHRAIADLPEVLSPGDLLVVNDTRVVPARLFGTRRPGGGAVEMLLAERHEDDARLWDVLLKPGRRMRPGSVVELDPGLTAEVVARGPDGRFRVCFSEPVEPHLDRLGHVPLPPYIKRPDEPLDKERYQTVYARRPGAIAAPTAGLHFTGELLEAVAARRVERTSVTLHVGLGTFKPVTAGLVHEHTMDAERFEVPAASVEAIEAARRRGGRVVAVGTTVVRALEGAAAAGGGELAPGSGETDLFIYPGYRFAVVDALLTNFHLPGSTLLMLVCAFAGTEGVLAAYAEAVTEGYRFYSYGDAMFVARRSTASGPRAS